MGTPSSLSDALANYLPRVLGWLIFLLPTALLLVDFLINGGAISDMVFSSIGLLIAGAFSGGIIYFIFVFIRKSLFSIRYKKAIKAFLSEKVEFLSVSKP